MSLMRTYMERLSRGRTLWRRLPEPFSSVHVLTTPDAALSILKPGKNWCDVELIRIVAEFVSPGDVVWDVGANLGIFGAAAAARSGSAGSVLCVEPDLTLAQLIRRTARRLPENCAKLQTLAAAVGDACGVYEFHIAARGRASNALAQYAGRSEMGGVREKQLVPVLSLDDVLRSMTPPAVVKIDVEGAEATIFQGASQLLHKARPLIYVEVGSQNVGKVAEPLHSAQYDLFDPSQPLRGQAPLETCAWNTLAIPREKRQNLEK